MSFSISASRIEPSILSETLQDKSAGAFASFEGWVRDNNDGHKVTALEYEIFHALALSEGQKIIDEAKEKFGLIDARAVHREGLLALGDCAVWIGVTARHRSEAFEACRYIIDETKHRLPVWKKEFYKGLEPQWVNCQHQHHHIPQPQLSSKELYARQTILSEVGDAGQDRLTNAKVLIVGLGGLGSSAALALAAAGVGTVGIAEYDVLQISNLHRQTLYAATDIGKPKAGLAAAKLKELNPLIHLNIHPLRIDKSNVEDILKPYDLVLDCTDNFKTKYLLNDTSIRMNKILIQSSIYRFEGQLLIINPASDDGCLRCLWSEAPLAGMIGDCEEVGVLGTVPALFGTLQANEAIKIILGLPTLKELLLLDLINLETQKIQRRRDADCAVCGKGKLKSEDDIDYLVQERDTFTSLNQNFHFVDVREAWEVELHPVDGALHLPSSNFNDDALPFDKTESLLLICAKGIRSRAAAEYLRSRGWSQAYNLDGGVNSLPLTKVKAV